MVHDNLVIVFITKPGSLIYNAGFQYTMSEVSEWIRSNISEDECEGIIHTLRNAIGFGHHIEVRMK